MSELQPSNTDAILGGQNPQPLNAAVLGGVVGAKRKLANELGLSNELAYELIQTHDIFSFETVTVNDRGEIITRTKKSAFYYTENLGNDVTLDMIYIPAGSSIISSPHPDEQAIELAMKSFYMAKYPITQAQHMALMGKNLSYPIQNDNFPVTSVTFQQAQDFCLKLSEKSEKAYILPSDIQWEYACRAGTYTPFYFGETITTDLANYNGTNTYVNKAKGLYRKSLTEVDKFDPNAFGLYDMHGNVGEYCVNTMLLYGGSSSPVNYKYDDTPWTHKYYYKHPSVRGGSLLSDPYSCRSSSRDFVLSHSESRGYWGFRVSAVN
jgi:formylglycine-generating enzyme required for sulfatase activity